MEVAIGTKVPFRYFVFSEPCRCVSTRTKRFKSLDFSRNALFTPYSNIYVFNRPQGRNLFSHVSEQMKAGPLFNSEYHKMTNDSCGIY